MRRLLSFTGLLAVLIAAFMTLSSCQDTPQPLPVRTLERAQRMDFLCLRIYDDARKSIVPEPAPRERCASAASYNPVADFSAIPFHFFGVITQTLRGELAVSDLTVGRVVDTDFAVPGVNHIPIGALPLDVAAAPNSEMVFVSSGEVNKFAVYGIPSSRILGDAFEKSLPPSLGDWPACSLPEPAHAIMAVEHPRVRIPNADADAGAGDAGDAGDAGAATPADAGSGAEETLPGPADYDVVLVFRGEGTESKIATLDVDSLRRGAGILKTPGPTVRPGSLDPCPIKNAVTLARIPDRAPATAGPVWSDGLPYVDGGGVAEVPIPATPFCAAPAESGDAGATPTSDAGSSANATPSKPIAGRAVREGSWLYVADDGQSIIHVLDLSQSPPVEVAPLVLTRLSEPAARVAVTDIAVSPVTRDYKRFLYAVDSRDGSILVFDVTDPATTSRLPLTRPHPETNPIEPTDRISLGGSVATVTFARFDYPLGENDRYATKSGVLCNPSGRSSDLGYPYSSNLGQVAVGPGLGPARLRGVFAFAVLTSGQMVVIDVDDWDAPCRRPSKLDGTTSDTSPAQVARAGDPYGVPESSNVTNEVFFPMSAPHRMRSSVYMRNDPTLGNRIPRVESIISLELDRSSLPTTGRGAEANPIILPTNDTVGLKAAAPGGEFAGGNIQMSFEAANVHLNQDWVVTYEGLLPTVEPNALVATMSTRDEDTTLDFSIPGAGLCARGIEDHTIGAARGQQVVAEQARLGYPVENGLDRLMTDYAVITDDLLGPDDPYWQESRACWGQGLDNASSRYEACQQTYGSLADNTGSRDFPILNAFDDRLVVGAFTANREVSSSETNRARLRFMRCCFHDQARFLVRTGGEWLALGSVSGFSRHVEKAPSGACVLSCDRSDALLNARAPAIARPSNDKFTPSRNSALALRNAQLSFVVFNGASGLPKRDMIFRFTTRGEFVPITLSIAPTSVSVAPQSIYFVDPFGQIAIVDGQSQGVTLIDLSTLSISRTLF